MPVPTVSPFGDGCVIAFEREIRGGIRVSAGAYKLEGRLAGKGRGVVHGEAPRLEMNEGMPHPSEYMRKEVAEIFLFLKRRQKFLNQHLIPVLNLLHLPQFHIFKGQLHSFIPQSGNLRIQVLNGTGNRP